MCDDKNASALMLAAVAVAIVAFSTVASFGADQCGEGREPVVAALPIPRMPKPTLYVAVDDGLRSRWLVRELQRDWTKAHSSIVLTRNQGRELSEQGAVLNAMQAAIRARFTIRLVDQPEHVHCPAVRINHGRWETLDARAFAFETRPLLTLDWYRARHVMTFDRRFEPMDMGHYWTCNGEGWSGDAEKEPEPPWVVAKAAESKAPDDLPPDEN